MDQQRQALDLFRRCLEFEEHQRESLLAESEPALAARVRAMLDSDRHLNEAVDFNRVDDPLPSAVIRSRPTRGPWLRQLFALDAVAVFLYIIFWVAFEGNLRLFVKEAGGPTRAGTYLGGSFIFLLTAAWLGYKNPDDPVARLGYAALFSESFCLLSASCVRPPIASVASLCSHIRVFKCSTD